MLEGNNRPDRLTGATQVSASTDLSSLTHLSGNSLGSVTTGDLAVKDVDNVAIGFFQGYGGSAWAYRLVPSFEAKQIGSEYKAGTKTGNLAQTFGSMWTFQNEIYAAANNGDGIYRLLLDNFDFDNPSKAVFEYVGPSIACSGNDGMNCLNGKEVVVRNKSLLTDKPAAASPISYTPVEIDGSKCRTYLYLGTPAKSSMRLRTVHSLTT